MTRQLPAERPLPDPQRILLQILADPQSSVTSKKPRRRWIVPAVAAASVAAIITAALIAPQSMKSGDPVVTPASQPVESETSIDLGPLSQEQIQSFLKHCWFWNGDAKQVLHTRRIRIGWGDGEEWTVALKGYGQGGNGVPPGDNRLTACSGRPNARAAGNGGDRGFEMENFIRGSGPALSEAELAKLPKGSSFATLRYDDSFRPDEGFSLRTQPGGKTAASLWIRVPQYVARVRQRLVVNGNAQQWFSSKPHDGLSFVRSWMDAPVRGGDKIDLEVQFLDSSDRAVQIPGSNGPTSVLHSRGLSISSTVEERLKYIGR